MQAVQSPDLPKSFPFIVIYLYFIFDIKDLIYFYIPCGLVCSMRGARYMGVWAGAALVSARNVTKHGDRSRSPTGADWVSDGVGIDFAEYICYKGVRFFGSLE